MGWHAKPDWSGSIAETKRIDDERCVANMVSRIRELEQRLAASRDALTRIATHQHCRYDYSEHNPQHRSSASDRSYEIGVADGHRCAAEIAGKALSATRAATKEEDGT